MALTPPVFKNFSTSYAENKHPSPDMMAKILTSDYDVPSVFADHCASLINENGRYVEMIRDLSGSASVLMDTDSDTVTPDEDLESGDEAEEIVDDEEVEAILPPASNPPASEQRPRAIFLGHGKKHGPLEKLEKILRSFQLSTKRPEKKRI